jgi:hypothetical protein
MKSPLSLSALRYGSFGLLLQARLQDSAGLLCLHIISTLTHHHRAKHTYIQPHLALRAAEQSLAHRIPRIRRAARGGTRFGRLARQHGATRRHHRPGALRIYDVRQVPQERAAIPA